MIELRYELWSFKPLSLSLDRNRPFTLAFLSKRCTNVFNYQKNVLSQKHLQNYAKLQQNNIYHSFTQIPWLLVSPNILIYNVQIYKSDHKSKTIISNLRHFPYIYFINYHIWCNYYKSWKNQNQCTIVYIGWLIRMNSDLLNSILFVGHLTCKFYFYKLVVYFATKRQYTDPSF